MQNDNQPSSQARSESSTPMSKNNKKLIVGLVVLILVALIVTLFAVKLLISDDKPKSNSKEETSSSESGSGSGGTPLKGTSSELKGGVISFRNLKGLTLRINQLDTCSDTSITAYVAVASDRGVVNTDFGKADVKIYLDDKEVKNFDFNPAAQTKQPINNVLVIDHSGSMKGAPMDNAKAAAAAYVQATNAEDKTAIVQFDTTVDVLTGLTSDKAAATNAVNGIGVRGDTALYDAITAAVDQLPACGRKAVTVLSDGDDTASKGATAESAGQKAVDAKLPVFSMGLAGEGFNPGVLQQISNASGGQYLQASTPAEIGGLYKNIDGQLRGQFAASFKINLKRDGQPHTLKIVSTVQGSPTESTRTFNF